MNNTIVFISCGKNKSEEKSKAKDLYLGELFKKQLAYARKLQPNDKNIYILSAKHGVLNLDKELYPYDLKLNDLSKKQQKEWAYKCYLQLKRIGIDFNEKTIFLTSSTYAKYLKQLFPNHEEPLKSLGIGTRMKMLKEWLNE